jgi:hypothetical protein
VEVAAEEVVDWAETMAAKAPTRATVKRILARRFGRIIKIL